MKMANTNYKLHSFDKIPSTQTYAHELIASGRAADKTIILADAQSAGRGRYRRQWVSHHGNLYVSFIYKMTERDPRLSYAVAVAVAETLIAFGGRPEIKWPNDTLIEGKKISGILIEYAKNFVIIGIGINIKTNPTVRDYKTTKVEDFAPNATRDEILAELTLRLDKWRGKDFLQVRDRWTAWAANLNKTITYRGHPAILCGLNDDGALVLRRGKEYVMAYGDEISI